MKKIFSLILLMVGLLVGSILPVYGQSRSTNKTLVVEVSSGTEIKPILDSFNLKLATSSNVGDCYLVKLPSDEKQQSKILEQLAMVPGVVQVEYNVQITTPISTLRQPQGFHGGDPDKFTTNSRSFNLQPLIGFLRLDEAQNISQGRDVTVAVIDTGIDLKHPAFAGHIATNGYDFLDNDSYPNDEPGGASYGHGSFVAGLILLVAPQAKILPLRAMDPAGNGDAFTVATSIHYAVDQGAAIINLSLGTDEKPNVLREAIAYARQRGCIVTAAIGNNNDGDNKIFPANESGVMGVAATDFKDKKASFSNYGQTVAISAPGVDLISVYPEGRYARWSGTSFATAIVSGATALLVALPQNRFDIIKELQDSAVAITFSQSNYQNKMGHGRVEPLAALNKALSGDDDDNTATGADDDNGSHHDDSMDDDSADDHSDDHSNSDSHSSDDSHKDDDKQDQDDD